MAVDERRAPRRRTIGGLSYRTVGIIVIAALVVLFIALNRDKTEISFLVFDSDMSLWVALTLAAGGGFIAGYLMARRRSRR
jgi:uncharacterized integral membrane protein